MSDESEKCQRCHKEDANPLHKCPFQQDVHNDEEFQCNCCEECTYQCALDI